MRKLISLAAVGLLALSAMAQAPSRDVLLSSYNSPTVTNIPVVVTVTGTASTMLAANAHRKWAQLQNVGSVDVKYAIGQTVTTTAYHGIIKANGFYYVDTTNFHALAINGITDSGSASISVLEATW